MISTPTVAGLVCFVLCIKALMVMFSVPVGSPWTDFPQKHTQKVGQINPCGSQSMLVYISVKYVFMFKPLCCFGTAFCNGRNICYKAISSSCTLTVSVTCISMLAIFFCTVRKYFGEHCLLLAGVYFKRRRQQQGRFWPIVSQNRAFIVL